MATDDDLGTVREVHNGYEMRFERHFERPLEEVWQAITEPEQLGEWIGPVEVDLRPGGRIKIGEPGRAGIDGEVLEVREPSLFSFKWDSSEWGDGGPVRFELTEDENGGTLLVFTHVAPAAGFDEFRTQTLTGWHDLLALLGSSVAGHPHTFELAWQGVHARYAGSRAFAPAFS